MVKNKKWDLPEKPIPKSVIVIPANEAIIEENGFYLSNQDANNLSYNIIELKAYVEKLESLLNAISEYENK